MPSVPAPSPWLMPASVSLVPPCRCPFSIPPGVCARSASSGAAGSSASGVGVEPSAARPRRRGGTDGCRHGAGQGKEGGWKTPREITRHSFVSGGNLDEGGAVMHTQVAVNAKTSIASYLNEALAGVTRQGADDGSSDWQSLHSATDSYPQPNRERAHHLIKPRASPG